MNAETKTSRRRRGPSLGMRVVLVVACLVAGAMFAEVAL